MNRIKLLAFSLLLSVPARAYDTIRFLEPIKGEPGEGRDSNARCRTT